MSAVPCRVDVAPSSMLAHRVGARLREARRMRRLRRRHLADHQLTATLLRDAEQGRLPLSAGLLTELAGRYALELGLLFDDRTPLRLTPGRVAIADLSEPCRDDSPTSVLEAYLKVLRRTRTASEAAAPLRRDDIRRLANHLDVPCTHVVSRLADLMAASGAHTRAMLDLYLAGASVVGLAGIDRGAAPLP